MAVIDNAIHDGLEGFIAGAIQYLRRLEEEYPNALISYENIGEYGNTRYALVLKDVVDETDEQYAKRIANEERYEKMREDSERKQYEALKAKFEN